MIAFTWSAEYVRARSLLESFRGRGVDTRLFHLPHDVKSRSDRMFELAGFSAAERQRLKVRLALFAATALTALLAMGSSAVACGVLGLSACIECVALKRRIFIRWREFDRDLPTFLTTLAASLRTGSDPRDAFREAVRLFRPSSVLHDEVTRVISAWASGASDKEAIGLFGSTVDHADAELFRAAALLALAHGTAFSECLHRLAKVTRQRQSFRRKIRAALAMQRLSAVGILGCAVCISAFQFLTNRQGVLAALNHSSGKVFLLIGGVLIVSGVLWMSRIGLKRV